MKQISILFFSLALIFGSCKSKTSTEDAKADDKPLTAQQYYQRIVDLEESMSEPLLKTEAEIKARGDKGDFAGMAKSAKAMEDTIDIRIDAVNKMDAVGVGGDDFKTVAMRYFQYIKSIYTTYKEIAEATTDKDKSAASDKMTSIISAQPGVMDNLNNAQIKFSTDNHFVLDSD